MKESTYEKKFNNQIQTDISKLDEIIENLTPSSDLRFSLSCLQSKLEQLIIQNEKINIKFIFQILIRHIFLETRCKGLMPENQVVYLWPIQYLHCDFLSLAAKGLQERKIQYRIMITRDNLFSYMKNKGHEVTKVNYEKSIRTPTHIIREVACLFKYLFKIYNKINDITLKKAFLNLLCYIEQPLRGRAAAKEVMLTNQKQYHLIGYDLSAVGWAIIKQAKMKGLSTGRIQNGAPNYNLAGYSEVDDLFLWDKYSAETYLKNGFRGRAIITGNILLQDTVKFDFNTKWMDEIKSTLNQYKLKVFVAMSGPGHNTSINGHIASLEEIKKIISHFSNFIFLIKLHPKDDIKYYCSLKDLNNVTFTDYLQEKPDALSLIYNCNAIITGASAVCLDALQLNKTVISVDPLNELIHFDFLHHSSIINTNRFSDKNTMFRYIENIISQPIENSPIIYTDGVSNIVSLITHKLNLTTIQ